MIACAPLLVALAGQSPADELSPPCLIEAGGAAIDVEGGNAAPFVHDIDGDGLPDLMVGQLEGGRLRIYRNVGARGAPRFEGFQVFHAGEAEGTVPFG